MSEPLGFDECGVLRVSKSADTSEILEFPSTYDFTGYTGSFVVRASEDADTALLTVTSTANGAGSVITFSTRYITLLIKKADLATLPEDATDSDEPWVGVYEWVVTDTTGLISRMVTGSIIVERGVVR